MTPPMSFNQSSTTPSPATLAKPIILDGGFSRELIRLGAPFKQPEWSALALIKTPSGPEYVRQVHEAFLTAGADVLTTNSYALVPFHIGEERFQQQGRDLAALAGRLARDAANDFNLRRGEGDGRRVTIAGCLPPIFGSYEPARFDEASVQRYLSVLVKGLEGFVDLWLGETLSLIAEADAVLAATKDGGKRVWISFTLDDTNLQDGKVPRLRGGEDVKAAAKWALDSGIEALLFNCSAPEAMLPAIRSTLEVFTTAGGAAPLIGVYANAFAPQSRDGAANESITSTRTDLGPEEYLELASKWVDAGARIVGGCCGIGCEHIRVLSGGIRDLE